MPGRGRCGIRGCGQVSGISGSGCRFRGQLLPPGSPPGSPVWLCCWFQWGSRLPFAVRLRIGAVPILSAPKPPAYSLSVKSKGEQRQTPERIFLCHFGTLVTGRDRVVAGGLLANDDRRSGLGIFISEQRAALLADIVPRRRLRFPGLNFFEAAQDFFLPSGFRIFVDGLV